jgi:excisionase family DNA binding protein
MTVKETAKRLEISVSLTYALLTAGKLRGTRHGLGRGTWRISEEHLRKYMADCEAEPRFDDGPLAHIR